MTYLIVFDLDGTLVDSKNVHAEAFIEAAKKYLDKDQIDESKLLKTIEENFGKSGEYIAELIIENFGLNVSVQEFMKKKSNTFKQMMHKVTLFPCTYELLYLLKSKNNILVLASYSLVDEVELLLEHFKIKKYFDLVYGFDENNKLTKNEFLSKIKMFMKNSVEKFFIVDDFHETLLMAKNIGFIPIGVLTGRSRKEDFTRNGIMFFRNLCEIKEYFSRILE